MKRYIVLGLLLLAPLLSAGQEAEAPPPVELGPELRVDEPAEGRWDQRAPVIATTGAGTSLLVWQRMSIGAGDTFKIITRSLEGPEKLGEERMIGGLTAKKAVVPAVVTLAEDRVAVTWSSYFENARYAIVGRILDVGGRPLTSEFPLVTPPDTGVYGPRLAADGDGGFVAVWESNLQDGWGRGVYTRRFDAAGQPRGEELRVNQETRYHQSNADVAAAPDGSFLVVWSGYGAASRDRRDIYLRRLDAQGRPVGDELRLNEGAGGEQHAPAIAALGDRGFVVVWTGRGGVAGRRLDDRGEPEGPEFAIHPRGFDPAVASDGATFLVAWQGPKESDNAQRIWGRLYGAAAAAPLGPSFRISSIERGFSGDVALLAEKRGRYRTLWSSVTDIYTRSLVASAGKSRSVASEDRTSD